ncbi:MAG: murein L,D-transpeptidase catalytic domain family protein [Pseudomonadota bacterium]
MQKIKYCVFLCAFLSIVGWGPGPIIDALFTPSVTIPPRAKDWIDQELLIIDAQANNLDPKVLTLGLLAYLHAREKGFLHKPLLTLIDYSKPSNERRLWVVDMRTNRVLFNTWVSHGKNSGDVLATSFSNDPGSLKSSIGVFLTVNSYVGENGYSLRLIGLEQGFNDHALSRSIVVHGAWYSDPEVIKKYGQLGRSWGCPSVRPQETRPLINTIKDNSLVVVYYPDRNWLKTSTFLITG